MLNFLRRKPQLTAVDNAFLNTCIINERQNIRDTDFKLLRSTITNRRKEVMAMFSKQVINEMEYQRQLDTLNIIEKHALDVVYLRNRERMKELGLKPKPRTSHLHGVNMANETGLEEQPEENE